LVMFTRGRGPATWKSPVRSSISEIRSTSIQRQSGSWCLLEPPT
jgi:hypothetical protein